MANASSGASSGTGNLPGDLGSLLRHWRDLRGWSQLDLSLEADVSQRHISFIESGRSVPGRQMLIALARKLDVPLRERNTLLLAAGYAPFYEDPPLSAPEMKGVNDALDRVLLQHEPYPAVVMDRYWNVLRTNAAVPNFFNCFIDLAARTAPRNLLHLMFDPAGMRPFIANWADVHVALMERIHREAVGRVLDETTRALIATLRSYGSAEPPAIRASLSPSLPMIPISFTHGDARLNYFSLVTTVGTPQTISAQELRLECMFPADDATERHHRRLLETSGASTRPASAG